MLRDHDPAPGAPSDPVPYPGDLVRLRAGHPSGADPHQDLLLADWHDEDQDVYLLYLPDTHPDYWDWAATATLADIAVLTRQTAAGARSWTL